MADLQRFDAGFLGISRLQCRHHAATGIAQIESGIEIARIAGPDETAVALQVWRIVDQRRGEIRLQRTGGLSETPRDVGQFRRQPHCARPRAEQYRRGFGSGERISHGCEIAWTTTAERQPRERPCDIGCALDCGPDVVAQPIFFDQIADGIVTARDRRRRLQGCAEPGSQLARARARDRMVDGRQQASLLGAG